MKYTNFFGKEVKILTSRFKTHHLGRNFVLSSPELHSHIRTTENRVYPKVDLVKILSADVRAEDLSMKNISIFCFFLDKFYSLQFPEF